MELLQFHAILYSAMDRRECWVWCSGRV